MSITASTTEKWEAVCDLIHVQNLTDHVSSVLWNYRWKNGTIGAFYRNTVSVIDHTWSVQASSSRMQSLEPDQTSKLPIKLLSKETK